LLKNILGYVTTTGNFKQLNARICDMSIVRVMTKPDMHMFTPDAG
jgi:hypothetical protein